MQSPYMSSVRSMVDQKDPLIHGLSSVPPSVSYSTKPELLPAGHLYLCNRRKDVLFSESGNGKPKPSMEVLQQSYKALNSRKLKETLSSFLPDIPGDLDSVDIPDTTLRGLIDHPPVGGADFLPLNGQALLGFRLVPGSLPEQYRMDPLPHTSDTKHHHKKKKRNKHKAIDKTDNGTSEQAPASLGTQAAPDALLFIHPDISPNPPIPHIPHPPSSTVLPSSGIPPKVVPHPFSEVTPLAGPVVATPVPVDPTGKKRKKKHENGDGQPKKKKKKDKDKKKKKERHHSSQDPPLVQASPLPALVPSAHTSFPHQPM